MPISGIAFILKVFSAINFLLGIIGLLMLLGNSMFGFSLSVSGIGGGFTLLAFAKVVDYLHEMVHLLRKISEKK